jgi:DNA-binding MarR family transcriptional regulator
MVVTGGGYGALSRRVAGAAGFDSLLSICQPAPITDRTRTTAVRTADDAFQDVLLALFQLHGRVLEAADAMSGGCGLTGARWQVMKVAARQSLTVSQIARRLGLKRQSVQRTVDQLAGQALVELRPNLDHSRAGLVALTPEGRRVLAALESRQQAWSSRCLRGLGRAELERLAQSLGDLSRRVESATEREREADGPRAAPPGARRAAAGVRRRLVAA